MDQARTWATRHVSAHSNDFGRAFAAQFGLSRAGAASFTRALEAEEIIVRNGSSTRPTFSAGPHKFLSFRYDLPGVDESYIWERDIAPYLDLPGNVANIAHFALTEMVNNANDHSGGNRVNVFVDQNAHRLAISIDDNGIGVFKKIADALGLEDTRLALLELSKGKFTSAPEQHSGEGIFFTSRAMDSFLLHANSCVYEYSHPQKAAQPHEEIDQYHGESNSLGTWIGMTISLNSKTELKAIFGHYTTGAPDDMTFSKTVIPVRLARVGSENLISRSQAKRLLARIDQFKNVQLDFSEVPEIGQAFADEIFRVFVLAHPDIALEAINANPDVARMIKRAQQTKVQSA
jgi:anti-sigma regulatory factor (Ser/Thr protein kinase)